MTTIYENTRHRRVLFLLVLAVLGSVAFGLMAILASIEGDQGNVWVGGILCVFCAMSLVGLEIYARRYIVAIFDDGAQLHLETRGLLGRHRVGPVTDVGEEIVESTDGLHHRYCRLTAGPNDRRFILDLTADRQVLTQVRKSLRK